MGRTVPNKAFGSLHGFLLSLLLEAGTAVLPALPLLRWSSRPCVVSPFLGIGVNGVGTGPSGLTDVGIFHARCTSGVWGELTIPMILR